MQTKTTRRPCDVAQDIAKEWKTINPYAEQYLNALKFCTDWKGKYICDSVEEIVIRFLVNATGWRGEAARRLKGELKAGAEVR